MTTKNQKRTKTDFANGLYSIRWTVFISALIGLTKDLLAPYVKFPVPNIVESNAPILFVMTICIGIVLLIYDNIGNGRRTPRNSKAPTKFITEIGIKDIALLMLKILSGIAVAVILSLVYSALRSAVYVRSVEFSELASIFSLLFIVWLFMPWRQR